MDGKTYGQLAEKTLSDKFYASDDKVMQRLLHGAIGIVTEGSELNMAVLNDDKINIVEECGDLNWYLSIFERDMGYNVDLSVSTIMNNGGHKNNIDLNEARETSTALMYESGILLDYFKKSVFYGRPALKMSASINESLNKIVFFLVDLLNYCGSNIEQIRRINIAKLSKRYPDGFSEFFAENRDLEAELRILRGRAE